MKFVILIDYEFWIYIDFNLNFIRNRDYVNKS